MDSRSTELKENYDVHDYSEDLIRDIDFAKNYLLFKDIVKYQNKREAFYLKQFKTDCINGYVDIDKSNSQEFADEMYAIIQNDTKTFASNYSSASIDFPDFS
mgnify:CR=1 FL=1